MAILLSCTENLLVLFKPMQLANETSIHIELGSNALSMGLNDEMKVSSFTHWAKHRVKQDLI